MIEQVSSFILEEIRVIILCLDNKFDSFFSDFLGTLLIPYGRSCLYMNPYIIINTFINDLFKFIEEPRGETFSSKQDVFPV